MAIEGLGSAYHINPVTKEQETEANRKKKLKDDSKKKKRDEQNRKKKKEGKIDIRI